MPRSFLRVETIVLKQNFVRPKVLKKCEKSNMEHLEPTNSPSFLLWDWDARRGFAGEGMKKVWVLVQKVFQCEEVFLDNNQRGFRHCQFLSVQDTKIEYEWPKTVRRSDLICPTQASLVWTSKRVEPIERNKGQTPLGDR